MKTKIIPLTGDLQENFYQLGLCEKEAFVALEKKIKFLLSPHPFLRFGQDVLSRARHILKKKSKSLFQECISSYSRGLGVDPLRYWTFLSHLEYASHSGHFYPKLKGILPGCTSVLALDEGDFTHTRLLDFPLPETFDENPVLYFFRPPKNPGLLSLGTPGMAPLFFQGIHEKGVSFALHYLPGKNFYPEGESIFEVVFEAFFKDTDLMGLKKELRKKTSYSEWSLISMDKSGSVLVADLHGPHQTFQSYHLQDQSPLIFTNVPLKQKKGDSSHFNQLSRQRHFWAKEKLSKTSKQHILDRLTDVKDQDLKNWKHPAATLTTVGAYHFNLSQELMDIKEGRAPLTKNDALVRFSLSSSSAPKVLKSSHALSEFERSWKRISRAQTAFDRDQFDDAYHELQMARALMDHPIWQEVIDFYLCLWDFKFLSNSKELSLVYQKLKKLTVPKILSDHWILLIMRFEKRLDLSPTVSYKDVSSENQKLFKQEWSAPAPLFGAWMKLLYPRIETLEVFSPYQK